MGTLVTIRTFLDGEEVVACVSVKEADGTLLERGFSPLQMSLPCARIFRAEAVYNRVEYGRLRSYTQNVYFVPTCTETYNVDMSLEYSPRFVRSPCEPKASIVSFWYGSGEEMGRLKWDGTYWRCYAKVKVKNVESFDGELWVGLKYDETAFPDQRAWVIAGGEWESWWGYGYPEPDQIAMLPDTTYIFTVRAGHNTTEDDRKRFIITTPSPPPPEQGTLYVDTTPVKGEVYVNGTSWGIAPQTRNLNPGTYTVSFGEVKGYTKPAPQTATVIEGQTTTITGTYAPTPTPKPKLQLPLLALLILATIGTTAVILKKE